MFRRRHRQSFVATVTVRTTEWVPDPAPPIRVVERERVVERPVPVQPTTCPWCGGPVGPRS